MNSSPEQAVPWMERLIAKSPLLMPALAMLSVYAAIDCSGWFWLAAVIFITLPAIFRYPSMSFVAGLLVLWVGINLETYHRDYNSISSEPGRYWKSTGSIRAASGKSYIFHPDNSNWFWLLSTKDFPTPLEIGQRYEIQGKAYEFIPPTGPGQFDRERWAYLRRIALGIKLEQATHMGAGDITSQCMAYSQSLRKRASALLREGASPNDETRQVMVSTVLGDTTDAELSTIEKFLHSGALHIFAVSGAQVAILSAMLLGLFKLLRIRHSLATLLTLPVVVLYVFVTGMEESAVRALIMIILFLLAPVLRHRKSTLNILGLAFIIMCLIDPLQPYQPGFQLSFIIFGVIAAVPIIINKERPIWAPDSFIPARIYTYFERLALKLSRGTGALIIVSISAWLISIPLTIWHFNSWNLYAVLSSILLTIPVTLIMHFSLAGICLSWVPGVLPVCNSISSMLAGTMVATVNFIANLPDSYQYCYPSLKENEALIIPHFPHNYSILLSNPAIVLNAGSASAQEFNLVPIMKARNISPAHLILTGTTKSDREGMATLKEKYPALPYHDATKNPPQSITLAPTNTLTHIPTPEAIRTGIHQDKSPIFLWQCHGQKVLIIGNARSSGLPALALTADLIIIGHHPRDPVMDSEWIQATGAKAVIFTTPHTCAVPEGVKSYSLVTSGTHTLTLTPTGICITPWANTETHKE